MIDLVSAWMVKFTVHQNDLELGYVSDGNGLIPSLGEAVRVSSTSPAA